MRDAADRERELGRRQRPHEHAVVDVAEMANAEIFARVWAEARPVGNVEHLERETAESIGIMASRQHDGGHRRRIEFRGRGT